LAFAPAAIAQTNATSTQGSSTTIASGQKMKLKGVVTQRDVDTFTVQDMSGVQVNVVMNDKTSVKSKGGFFGGGTKYGVTNILRGLNVEVDGRGDASGRLVADKMGAAIHQASWSLRKSDSRIQI
jgi:hypothetical protein